MKWEAVFLTFRLALFTVAILLVVGLPLAYWLAFTRWRWKVLIEAVVALPLVLPPTVLGFYLLVGLGANSPVGKLYEWFSGHRLGGGAFLTGASRLPAQHRVFHLPAR